MNLFLESYKCRLGNHKLPVLLAGLNINFFFKLYYFWCNSKMFITKTIFYKQSINYCHLATGKQMSRGLITQFAFRYHVDEELFQFTQKKYSG